MRKLIGKVLDKATTKDFSFAATTYFEGDFVEVDVSFSESKKGIVIGEVVTKETFNSYFENPSIIRYLKEDGESLASESLYIIKVKPIAIIEDEKVKKLDFPLPPGINVYSADENRISRVLGFENQGIPIGYLKQLSNLRVNLSEDLLCKTHFSILGRTGSGKSFFAKGLLKQIKDRNLIIFSPTEEYNEIAKNINADVFSKHNLILPLNTSYIAAIYGLSLQEEILFEKVMKKDTNLLGKETISNHEIAQIFRSNIRSKGVERKKDILFEAESTLIKNAPEEKLPRFFDTILSKIESKSLFFSNHPMKVPFSQSAIIDMSELEQESQQVIMMYVLNNLLESYKNEKARKTYPKLIIVIEEAHNFAPSIQTTICKNKIIQIAREGRKLGITLSLISQRPRYLDQTALSQCGSLFLFHIPHPDDIEHVFGISPIYRQDLIETVRELMVGDCLILGDVTKYPLLCSIDFKK